ncbi:MAG: hypothetical protein ACKN9O_05310, partial [Actinomycetota bacterium]
ANDTTAATSTTKYITAEDKIEIKAYGFHYSSPQIKIKFPQAAFIQPAPPPGPAPQKVVTKKITISCVKGKTTKKVTGLAPKCPAGYKIKR